jgi:23S rRNA pseudouridine1911/1915/1917 synthase
MAPVLDRDGRQAISEYSTLQEFPAHTLLNISILTGRTHQIRVHLGFLGCPVVGDKVYGRNKQTLDLSRQFLHAHQLSIIIPGETESRTFEATLAPDLEDIIESLSESTEGA